MNKEQLPSFSDGPRIRAVIYDADGRCCCEFDAASWFEQASDAAIVLLDEANWSFRGADAETASEHFDRAKWPAIDDAFRISVNGVECIVNEDDARAWIALRRPLLSRRISIPF